MAIKQKIARLLPDDLKMKLKNTLNIRKNRRMLKKCEAMNPYNSSRYPQGINLVGDISAETGLGQSMRILASIMEHGEIPFCVKQVNLHGKLEHNDTSWREKVVEHPKYGINVINLIPATWAADYMEMDKELLDGHYNIAYWPWELENFPKCWLPCIETVDEIWTPSEFTSKSIRRQTEKPVITVPHIVEPMKGGRTSFDRRHFGLPEEKFLFLTMYDFISISERKNPKAVIEAYQKAFPVEEEKAGLVIKVNHATQKDLMKLKEQLKAYQNIYFITGNLTREEVDSLIYITDVLVSLHRSEGFGLPVAEAMAMGKPVISTNWSATTEFMDESCACPVDYELIEIKKSVGPYEKGNYWADANVEHAASYMRRLWEDKVYAKKIGTHAAKYIQEHLTYEYAVGIVKERLLSIANDLAGGGESEG